MNNRYFRRGSGCFTCAMCGKRTRMTDQNECTSLCPVCAEISGMENSLSDNGWGKHGDLSDCKTIEEAREKAQRLMDAAKAGGE